MRNLYEKIAGAVLVTVFIIVPMRGSCSNLKLSETPLNQVIELYSKETGRSVLVDETVQQHRKVTAHLQGMNMEESFEMVKKILGLESILIGSNTILLYPPERASRYQPRGKPMVIQTPSGLDVK